MRIIRRVILMGSAVLSITVILLTFTSLAYSIHYGSEVRWNEIGTTGNNIEVGSIGLSEMVISFHVQTTRAAGMLGGYRTLGDGLTIQRNSNLAPVPGVSWFDFRRSTTFTGDRLFSPIQRNYIGISFPLPLVLLLTVYPTYLAWCAWRQRNRFSAGHCQTCGYDLRATPERCPECGHRANARGREADTVSG
ncbi:MAG: hypothetical protein H7144_05125 [Burkholderiales bacterium]|nr:hypothetical protein [Phycisphaerae bacterium]